ncbi:glycosyltransferase [Chryseobacterium kwangjuense]|uniref:Glycosyl transferase family 1 domain-containing protein n=1 Tax=Chryseobacterium kwangjuense TaxID=267125 RepID=A0A135WDK3_9FLAO|nr:glycosyltransferase [Chryseobacterium kwangjuense]KXH83004.1 hypothetical protein AU378_11245 [Chryseobacterium kwangjuense]
MSIDQKNFDLALRLIELSSHLQYNYCFRDTLYDKELEDALKEISEVILDPETIEPEKGTVLFYDYFGYDNRGLTQQYLRALKRLNKRIILVFESKNRHYKNEAILSEIENYSNKSVYYLEGNNRIEYCKNLLSIISAEKPEHILMHLIPWDTIAYMAFNRVKGIKRYQINLTDHTFWLGVDIIDVNIEFRSFGLNLSEQLRNIPDYKNRILPYYPILSKSEFQGFDFDTAGKKIIFSGSSFHKILDNQLTFFETIHKMLKLDDHLVFVLAGSGNRNAIDEFIVKNNLQNRIFLIGDRYDLYEVMKKADYYIATFPLTGGLMAQIAAMAGLPVFAYIHPESLYNDLNDLFYKSPNFKNIDNLDTLVHEFSITHNKGNQPKEQEESMINEEEFATALDEIFHGKNPMKFLEKRQNVVNSYKQYNMLMIESENLYNPVFQSTLNRFLSHQEKCKMVPGFKRNYFKKLFRENKVQFLKALYHHLKGK